MWQWAPSVLTHFLVFLFFKLTLFCFFLNKGNEKSNWFFYLNILFSFGFKPDEKHPESVHKCKFNFSFFASMKMEYVHLEFLDCEQTNFFFS